MAKARALQKRVSIPQISNRDNFQRLRSLLNQKYQCKPIEDRGEYVVGHCRISLSNDQQIDVVVFTTDIALIRSSPKLTSDLFNTISSTVENLAKQATSLVSITRPLPIQRAKTILDYASTLNPTEELQRMVIVILCDTSNEIILREQMKALVIQGSPLDDGVPDKIRRIEGKGQVVYRSEEIKSLRDFGNGIVHQGNIPDQAQASKCLEIARDFLSHT